MRRTADLTGRRFGKLLVMEKTGEREDRYHTWHCKCDCGKELIVNTKRLTRGTISHCGCEKKSKISIGPIPEDLTGNRYGKLTVLRIEKRLEDGKSSWFCQCDCGNQCIVTDYSLHYKKRRSCGCLHRGVAAGESEDLTNHKFGILTVLERAEGENSSVFWKCRCACGNEINVSQESLLQGHFKSCGCVRQKQQASLHENLTHIGNTCIEVLERRKSRNDNTSGFRGVSKGPNGKWMVTIGLQSKRYYVGLYADFEDAVQSRLYVEEALHEGFVDTYEKWKVQADLNQDWAEEHPFYFEVEKKGGAFHVQSVFGDMVVDLP